MNMNIIINFRLFPLSFDTNHGCIRDTLENAEKRHQLTAYGLTKIHNQFNLSQSDPVFSNVIPINCNTNANNNCNYN